MNKRSFLGDILTTLFERRVSGIKVRLQTH